MTNEVRLENIVKAYGDRVTCVKGSTAKTQFKGWQIVLNDPELVKLNGEKKNLIHEKGLLECLQVLNRLNRQIAKTEKKAQ